MTLSGYFMLKSVFGQQSCRALTFALARLSCLTKAAFFGYYFFLLFIWLIKTVLTDDFCYFFIKTITKKMPIW